MILNENWQVGNVVQLANGKKTKIKAIKKIKNGKTLFFVEGKFKAFKDTELFEVETTAQILLDAGFAYQTSPMPHYYAEGIRIFVGGNVEVFELVNSTIDEAISVNSVNLVQNILLFTPSWQMFNNF